MNNRQPHAEDGILLRLLDGELKPSEKSSIERHLAACWHCRTRLGDLQTSIADFIHYRENALRPALPDPPAAWPSLRGRMREAAAPLEPRRPIWNFAARRPAWLTAAVAACLVAALVFRFTHEPVASASELLQKATAAEAKSSLPRRIQIKTGKRSIIRAAVLPAADSSSETALQPLFVSAGFSWEEPFSARSFEVWHDGLARKTDGVRVIETGNAAGSLYEIRTTTSASPLTEASLTLRSSDWKPIRETLKFGDQDVIEISELPDSLAVAAAPAPSAPPLLARARTSAPPDSPLAGPSVELRVAAALHSIGADLGEPVEISRPDERRLLVTGTGLDAGRREQVRLGLEGIPGVEVRFEEPETILAQDSPARAGVQAVSGQSSLLGAQLESYTGGGAAYQKYKDRILDTSESTLARAHALNSLASRFPAQVEERLSASELTLLAQLREDHLKAIADSVKALAALLKPAIELPLPGGPPEATWQENAHGMLESVRETDRMLNQLLAAGGDPGSPQPTPAALGASLSRLLGRIQNMKVR